MNAPLAPIAWLLICALIWIAAQTINHTVATLAHAEDAQEAALR